MIFHHGARRDHWSCKGFSESPFIRCFRGLGHYASSSNIPSNQPTIFHPSLIEQYLLQTSRRKFCVPVSQQYHLSQIDGALMHNESMIILHWTCQIQKELIVCCNHIWLNLGSLADFALSVYWKSEYKYYASWIPLL